MDAFITNFHIKWSLAPESVLVQEGFLNGKDVDRLQAERHRHESLLLDELFQVDDV